jgi:succinate dehydrogenase flavin-adding protein (antitoxin of CptAB toxin-antitoxin module)
VIYLENDQKLTLDYFINKIQSTQDKLNRAFYFLKWASDNPKLFFTDSKRELGTEMRNSNIIFAAMDYERKLNTSPKHDLQKYIGDELNDYFQHWLHEEKGYTNEDLKVEVSTENSFPSLYCVKHKDNPIIYFDIYEQFWGIRNKVRNELDIRKTVQQNKNKLKEENEQYENKLELYRKIKHHPIQFALKNEENRKRNFYGLLNDLYIVVFHQMQIKNNIPEKIKKYQKLIDHNEEEIIKWNIQLQKDIKYNFNKQCAINIVKQLFDEIRYREETETYKLY